MIVKGDQPLLHKLTPFDIKLIPDTTLRTMNKEIIKITSPAFFSGLKLHSVKLFDSASAIAWSWTNPQIVDHNYNPVYFFYSVLFETTTTTGAAFIFRIDVLKNGQLLNKDQIAFFRKEKLKILECNKIMTLILADTIQPFNLIEDMALAYSPMSQTVVWTVTSVLDPKTAIQHFKQVNAYTGAIIGRSFVNLDVPPEMMKFEEAKIQK